MQTGKRTAARTSTSGSTDRVDPPCRLCGGPYRYDWSRVEIWQGSLYSAPGGHGPIDLCADCWLGLVWVERRRYELVERRDIIGLIRLGLTRGRIAAILGISRNKVGEIVTAIVNITRRP